MVTQQSEYRFNAAVGTKTTFLKRSALVLDHFLQKAFQPAKLLEHLRTCLQDLGLGVGAAESGQVLTDLSLIVSVSFGVQSQAFRLVVAFSTLLLPVRSVARPQAEFRDGLFFQTSVAKACLDDRKCHNSFPKTQQFSARGSLSMNSDVLVRYDLNIVF